MQTITIQWSGAFSLERFDLCVLASDKGIYAISRIWGNWETLLYIGRTKREFQKRLREHDAWLKLYRGQIKVRIGRIKSPSMTFSEKLLADAECLLIISNETVENTSNVSTYSGRALTINNTGRRGLLEKWISSDDLEDY
ncbi:GIY-YIG nuclease family protein [Desulfosporosinus burensis]